jgi:alkylhydroperoxidase/carboxymuconolactone decarboxylase family protein YurZ
MCGRGGARSVAAGVNRVEELLHRLALNDERSVGSMLAAPTALVGDSGLDRKTEALVRLGALVSVGACTTSLRWTVEMATAAAATDEEILGVLLAVGPAVGLARIVAAAPELALALGYEMDES